MADKQYLVAAGFVQKFGEKEAVVSKDVNGKAVREFVIKAVGSQKLIRITLWPELAGIEVGEGYYVAVEGAFTQSGDNNQFYNISALRAFSASGGTRVEREVVNQQPADAPAAAPASDDPPPF